MQKYLVILLVLFLCLFAASTIFDIARYFINGMPNHDYYVLPGGVFILMIVLPAIYILINDFIKKRIK
jgi:hypothetical protein